MLRFHVVSALERSPDGADQPARDDKATREEEAGIGEEASLDEDAGLEEEVVTILATAPELLDRFVALLREADGDPGAAAFLGDLAEHVSQLATTIGSCAPRLAACLAAVEAVATSSPDAEELVGWAFLDSLSDEELRMLHAGLGARTLAILESMQTGDQPLLPGR